MSQKIDQIEAEAEAGEELAEEYTGDVLAHKFATLEKTAGADDELAELKRKMGLLPPEEKPAAKEEVQARVEAPPAQHAGTEEDQLAAALEEMEAEQQQEQKKMGR